MPDRYKFRCKNCGYTEVRYRNLKKCRKCNGDMVRLPPDFSVQEIQMRVEKRELHYNIDVIEFLLSKIAELETSLRER